MKRLPQLGQGPAKFNHVGVVWGQGERDSKKVGEVGKDYGALFQTSPKMQRLDFQNTG